MTLILMAVTIVIFAAFAISRFNNEVVDLWYFEDGVHVKTCGDLLDCLTSTLYWGLTHGGGVGEAMQSMDKPVATRYDRVVFDLAFFVLVLIVELNIIFGIIIDTFSQLRTEQLERVRFENNRCVICYLDRSRFDTPKRARRGFDYHIAQEHNM